MQEARDYMNGKALYPGQWIWSPVQDADGRKDVVFIGDHNDVKPGTSWLDDQSYDKAPSWFDSMAIFDIVLYKK